MANDNAKDGKTENTNKHKKYKNNKKNKRNTNVVNKSKFEGRCAELKGFIFDCSSTKCAEQFNTTMKEITTYLGKGGGGAYKYPGDIRYFLQNDRDPTITQPTTPAKNAAGEMDDTEKLI